uniref:Major facilitator transporter n=1 Tax=uncultured bacterium 89 TaxID=698393 RepID=E3T692_9BACT|nr:major facilitator transporter [uncultured bacterium 89]
MVSTPVTLRSYWRLVRGNPNFRRLWLAQIVSEIGDWFYTLAVYTLLLELTGKAQSVGLAVALQVLPQTLVGPTAGVVNDRLRRRQVMISADLVRAVIVACMLLARTRGSIWMVYPLLFVETVMWGFFEPARSAVIPNIVPAEDIVVANTLSATTWSFNLAIGATMGGIAGVLFGRETVFVLNALSFLMSAFLIGRMVFHEPHAAAAAPLRARDLVDFTPILEGIRYVRRDPRLLATVFLKGGVGMLGANWVIFPIMGARVFPVTIRGLDPSRGAMLGMSLLMGARGVGALLGPLLSAGWAAGKGPRMRKGILVAFLLSAIGYMGLSRAPVVALACACVVLSHAGGSVVWVFSTTLLQRYTEDRFRGRVFSADLGFCMLAIATTSYIASLAVDAGVSVRTVALATGIAMLIPAGAWFWALRRWQDNS